MEWRCEAWTLPGSPTFELIVEVPLVAATLNDTNQPWGTGSISVPADFEYVSLIADVEPETPGSAAFSLLRFFRPGQATPDFEFYADEASRGLSDDGQTVYTITGRDIRSGPDDGIVYERVEWGSSDNLLGNAGFEGSSFRPEVNELHFDATVSGGSFDLSFGGDTATIPFGSTANTVEAALEADIAAIDDVLVTGSGVAGDPYIIEAVNPAVLAGGLVFDGSALTPGPGITELYRTQFGALLPTSWTKSQNISVGVANVFGVYDSFLVTSDQAHSGTYSLRIDPGTLIGQAGRWTGTQQVVTVQPNGLYQAKLWIRPTSASDKFRFIIRGIDEDWVAGDLGGTSFTANTWTEWVIPDIDVGNRTQIIFRVANVNNTAAGDPANPSIFYIDDAETFAGFAADTPGVIVPYLVAAAQARGALTWLDTSTITTTDSGGTAWPQDESFSADRGQQIASHVIVGWMALGYEFDVTPKATPSGGFTHDLKMFVPGGRDNEPNIGVFTGLFTGGTITKRRPLATHVLVEDVNQNTIEVTDAAFSGVPRRESFIRAEFAADLPTAGRVGTAALNDDSKNLVALQANIVPDVVAYEHVDVGDTVPWTVLGDAEKHDRRIATITLGLSSGESGKVWSQEFTASRVFAGEAAIWEAFRILFSEWRRLTRPAPKEPTAATFITGGGGTPSIYIAAADATDLEKANADFRVVGGDATPVINQALLSLDRSTAGGRLIFSSGTFDIVAGGNGGGITFTGSAGGKAFEFKGVGAFGGNSTQFRLVGFAGTNPRMLDSNSMTNVTVRNITFLGNGIGSTVHGLMTVTTGSFQIYECSFYQLFYGATSGSSTAPGCKVVDSYFNGNVYDIRLTASPGAVVVGNYCTGATGTDTAEASIRVTGSTSPGTRAVVAHNQISSCASYGIYTSAHTFVHHNGINAATNHGIYIVSGGPIVESNTIRIGSAHGIATNDSPIGGGRIAGNQIEDSATHGIFIDQSDWRIFDNEVFGAGQDTADTYDGIHIAEPAYVSRNTIDGDSGQTRYGINIASGTGSIVVANDLKAAADYGSGDFNDSGTSTVTTFPGGAIGDNFST